MDQFAMTGTIKLFAGMFAPTDWLMCDGSMLQVSQFRALFKAIGATYGGDGVTTFALPDFRGRIPVGSGNGAGLTPRAAGQIGGAESVTLISDNISSHSHTLAVSDAVATSSTPAAGSLPAESQGRIYASGAPSVPMASNAIASAGSGTPHDNVQPSLCINHIICANGFDPAVGDNGIPAYFVGEVIVWAGNFAWKGLLPCEGQLINLMDNPALFSILGTVFGGTGVQSFAVPDLRGRAPMGAGYMTGPGISDRFTGDTPGSTSVVLKVDNLPPHNHPLFASSATGLSNDAAGLLMATPFSGDNLYAPASAGSLVPMQAVQQNLGGLPHPNMQPYLPVTFMIATTGVYPMGGE